jgi:hypothetical protein
VEPKLKRIDLIDPWGDWPDWMAGSRMILEDERPKLTGKDFLASVAGLDPVHFLPGIDPSRVQMVSVAYDRDTPPAAKSAMESAMPKGAAIFRYATPAEFQAGMGGGDTLLKWLQPEFEAEKPEAAAHPGTVVRKPEI